MLINIPTPGWNEYEEEVNCSPRADPKGDGEIQRGCVITLIAALPLSLLFPLRRLFWIDKLTRNEVRALEVLSFKSSTSPSTPHSGEIRMSKKKHLISL